MSTFNTIDIPLDLILLKQDTIPIAMNKFIGNQGILETYIEDIYNKLEVDFSNDLSVMGKSIPIDLINANKISIIGLDSSGNIVSDRGLYIAQAIDNSSDAGYFKAVDIDGNFGTELRSDVVTVSKKLVIGNGAYIDKSDADGDTLLVEYLTVDIGYPTTNNILQISENTKNVIILDLKIDESLYNGGNWESHGNIPITLKFDTEIPPRDNQHFTIILRHILDSSGDTILNNYNYGYIYFKSDGTYNMDNVNDTDDIILPNGGEFVSFGNKLHYLKINDNSNNDGVLLIKYK